MENRGRSENTIKAYTTDIKMFFQEMQLQEVELAELEAKAADWMNKYRRVYSPKTVGRRVTSMRMLGNALRMQLLVDYSVPTAAQPTPHPLPGLAADLRRMVDEARNDEQRAMLALTGMCGLRVSEARAVGPNDFDFTKMTLTVRGKGDHTRIVPVSQLAWSVMGLRVISAKMNNEPTIITVTDRYARQVITQIGQRAKVARAVSSHDLRATFATLAYEQSGKDIRAVQMLLGHASVTQTQLYIGVTEETLRDAANFRFEDDDQEDEV